jgi:predicted component of type VI protein secretion system
VRTSSGISRLLRFSPGQPALTQLMKLTRGYLAERDRFSIQVTLTPLTFAAIALYSCRRNERRGCSYFYACFAIRLLAE